MTEREAVGLLFDARSDFNVRYDKRKDARRRDYGSIGEDADGIWVRRHPEVLLLERFPHLVETLDALQSGQTQLTAADFEDLAAPAYDAKLTLLDALSRMEG
jgi:hypothetical protein